ncbi:hypothetical protein Pmob_1640 [Petrotoga mobilis SJ95]|jgi:hypothetical protein|uniref:Uncharacterized protein n=1 Tax=Petrotoga mobilis (strain DSM 10674 / SJ95) TaxID=403833 RepID=A9BI43_PETMO|nr:MULTISPECIES: hypothetical protein [Petrotoga]MDK2811880.1 hypothetical protein [Petrotoga sp.]ABX32334.1 hypothetical protein Pmob_1640 [Petrotoga mobilis SJ95]MBL5981643.1 hypothetical protein [Petrotoga sp. 8T1HF07.NaAc.6.1]PNR87664.1 hypothetical protein X925_08250 [Petrotoga sp. 9T1HF07.CasAA.8.2]PNR94054.1 hypothetical protein X926_01485 [Petrotoga sp. HWHPT.55.6.3]
MNNIYGENSGKGFIKEVPLSTFAKAVESAIYKAPLRENNKVWLSDLWLITSLPEDLIKETISKYIEEIDIPEDVEEIYDDEKNKVLWKK